MAETYITYKIQCSSDLSYRILQDCIHHYEADVKDQRPIILCQHSILQTCFYLSLIHLPQKGGIRKSTYRVTIHVVPNLPLTSRQKFRFSIRPVH